MEAAALLGAIARGLVTAAAVGLLLLVARRWGRGTAGLLAGLPTITGPALIWLALDQGAAFATAACRGGLLAGACCALFALGYVRLGVSVRHGGPWAGRAAGLLGGSVLSALPLCLPGLDAVLVQAPPGLLLALVVACCAGCLAAMPLPPLLQTSAPAAAKGTLLTAAVSGLVSSLTSLLAPQLGPTWAGLLTSPPLLAAALALQLHRPGCSGCVLLFLRGYTAGLIGRSVFVVLFAALLVPHGLIAAVLLGGTAAALLGAMGAIRTQRSVGALRRVAPPARAGIDATLSTPP